MIDIIGDTYGRLTVLSLHSNVNYKKRFNCKCVCGKETIVLMTHLRTGHTVSCGCRSKECLTQTIHGEAGSLLYKVYYGMINRCYTPSSASYYKYGAKGIGVCSQWKNSYETFSKWAKATGYTKGLTIDREDCREDYSPKNCRWVNMTTQAHNRPKPATNKSGHKNIHFNKSKNKWVVRFTVKSKRIELPLCNSLEEALILKKDFLNKCSDKDVLDGAKYD